MGRPMTKLCIFLILAVAIASCCHQATKIDIANEIMKDPIPADDDTIIPHPPNDQFMDHPPLPEMIKEPSPIYPLYAMAKRIEASLIIQVYVDKYGFVRHAQILNCPRPNYGFEEAALASAYGTKYKPTIVNGQPLGTWITYPIRFSLRST
jgi:TonB family protein